MVLDSAARAGEIFKRFAVLEHHSKLNPKHLPPKTFGHTH
jgi:hypothetical protein